MGQTLVVGGWILLGAIPTAAGFIMWHNVQMQTVGSAWADTLVTATVNYESDLAESQEEIAASEERITSCKEAYEKSQKVVLAFIEAQYQNAIALDDFFYSYSFTAGDVGALYDVMDRSDQSIRNASAGVREKCS